MSTVSISDGKLKVLLSFWEKIGGLSGDISIPLGDVRGATADPTFIKNDLGIRAGEQVSPVLLRKAISEKTVIVFLQCGVKENKSSSLSFKDKNGTGSSWAVKTPKPWLNSSTIQNK